MHHGGIHEEEITGKAYDTRILVRFARYVKPYRTAVFLVLLVLPLIAVCRLAQPWIIKLAIDNYILPKKMEGLEWIAVFFLLILLAESLLSYLEVYLLQTVGQRVMSDMRRDLYSHVMRLPVSWFDRTPTGSMVTRLTSDIEVLGEMFASGVITIVGDILLLVGIISVMLWMNVKLSLVTFSILPFLFFIAWFFRRRMRQSFREVRAGLGRLNSYLTESIGGMTIIQVFNRQNDEERRFRELNTAYRKSNRPVIFWDASLYAIVEALSSVAIALLLWYGGGEILQGTLTFGVLVAFIQYIEKFFGPIRDLSAKYSVMQGTMAALERIFALQDVAEEQEVTRAESEAIDPDSRKEDRRASSQLAPLSSPQIEFRNVCFAYQSGEKALEDFNLVVNRGERVALVGESGGGKTTITRLLTRLYEIDTGAILIDGIDIREMPREELRKRVGVVLQDPCIFSGSIEFNIALGDEDASSRVHEAAATVGAARFIEERTNGYNEQARERGSNFSAGEKQLISFARAVAFNPEILVLDEATASVDSASEQMIQEGIRALMKGRTSLVIAHRLSTIRDADRIVVVHHGKKMEEGTHQELMEQRGYYFRLHQMQFVRVS